MNPAHLHPGQGAAPAGAVLLTLVVVAAAYLTAAIRLRRRGDAWPVRRDASFGAGAVALAWTVAGQPPGGPFTGHMVQHLLTGMVAPLLLVLARPLTLALRTLGPGSARAGLLSVARSRPADWLTFPPLAALLDVGGLWLLYRTELFAAVAHPWAHGLLHAHLLAAGLLFMYSVCQLDPVRRHRTLTVRASVLLAAGAAHGVLARTLYAAPPPGTAFAPADLHRGAQLMYYGGDLVEAGLAMVLGVGWYTATGRARAHRARRRTALTAGHRRPPHRAARRAHGLP